MNSTTTTTGDPQSPHMQNEQNQPTQIPQQIQQQQLRLPTNEIRTLWIGDLQYWMDETYIFQCFVQINEVASVKVIRNKHTIQPEGYAYGFIEFTTREAAERVLQTFNGTQMPNIEQNFRLNWASTGERHNDNTPEYTIFVGDLAMNVTDNLLHDTFRQRYASVKGAKVVTDKVTGRVKGYGFVMFSNESEQRRAMLEMNGQMCSSRPMRIGPAANKNSLNGIQGNPSESDPNNTTIFVGGLDPNVSDEALKQVFIQFGEIIHVKIPVGKRCGFVQFTERRFAEQALQVLNGTQLQGQSIRLSWGRPASNRQAAATLPQAHANGFVNGYYGYGNGYEAYGYVPHVPQDHNMYYTNGYVGYGNYQRPPSCQAFHRS